jgi:hypothetical protein
MHKVLGSIPSMAKGKRLRKEGRREGRKERRKEGRKEEKKRKIKISGHGYKWPMLRN